MNASVAIQSLPAAADDDSLRRLQRLLEDALASINN